jgi:hypothetical protein
MYSLYKKVNVPTWVIGPPLGIPSDHTPALTLQVWPERQEPQSISPADFNAEQINSWTNIAEEALYPSPLDAIATSKGRIIAQFV